MSLSRIKNIVIVILLLVNVAFGGFIIAERADTAKRERGTRESIIAIMAENGITVAPSVIPKDIALTEYLTGRDQQLERKAAQAVLGECSFSDQGGNIYSYESDLGVARFRGNGEFEITLTAQGSALHRPEDAKKLIGEMGVDAVQTDSRSENGETTEGFRCTVDGREIFGCEIFLRYDGAGLLSVTGKRPTGEPEYRTEGAFMTLPTVLMRFLDTVSSGGYVCSSIEKIECGYMFFTTVSAQRSLTPVWHIVTDTGGFFFNAVTGALISA